LNYAICKAGSDNTEDMKIQMENLDTIAGLVELKILIRMGGFINA